MDCTTQPARTQDSHAHNGCAMIASYYSGYETQQNYPEYVAADLDICVSPCSSCEHLEPSAHASAAAVSERLSVSCTRHP